MAEEYPSINRDIILKIHRIFDQGMNEVFGGAQYLGHKHSLISPLKTFAFCLCLVVAVFITQPTILAQSKPIDSSVLERDLARMDSLSNVDFVAAMALAKEIAIRAEAEGYANGVIKAKLGQSRIYLIRGQLDSAGQVMDEAYQVIDTVGHRSHFSTYLDLKGALATMMGKGDSAVGYYLQSYQINKQLDRPPLIMRGLANIAAVLIQQEQYEKALPYITEATGLAKDLEQWDNYASQLVNHSIALKHLGDTTQAFQRLQEAEQYIENANIYLKYAFHANMNDYAEFNREPASMLEHSQQMLDIARLMKSEEKEAYAYSGFSKYHRAMGELAQSEAYLLKAINLYEKGGEKTRLLNLYESAAELYDNLRDYRQAFDYQAKAHSLEKEIQDANMQSRILELETSFDLQRQKALNLENQLKLTETESALRSRTTMLYFSIGGILSLLLIGGLAYSNFRRKKQLQQQMIQQKEAAHQLSLMQEHNAGEEKERKRISRELHDNIGGLLAAAKLHLGTIHAEDEKSLQKVTSIIDKTHQEARTISHRLAPIKLEDEGLKAAVAYFCKLVAQKDTVDVHFESTGDIDSAGSDDLLAVYRTVQELVVNAIKHAEASEILVQIFRHQADLEAIVEDNGKGFTADVESEGIGLKNIKRQLELYKGTFDVRSAAGNGTSIMLYWPDFYNTDP
ncbi:MAG: hypothetical protein HKN87_21090 [Saprospiraceae bacterium]|nr:hypothetical protein [Saprospiraceae bacterium]